MKNHIYDFLVVCADMIVAWLAFSIRDNKVIFIISVIVFVLLLLVIIYLRMKEKSFYFVPLKKSQEKDNWIGRGTFEYIKSDNCFSITNSDAGYIFSKSLLWSNYSFTFDFKIINSCLGWILRAIDLSNYIMLQCGTDGINPHIKINGMWRKREHKDVELSFDKYLSLDKWYRGKLISEKRTVRITILEGESAIFDRHWNIPEKAIVEYRKKEGETPNHILLPINLDYGTVGFRCWGPEKGLVKNLLIEKL